MTMSYSDTDVVHSHFVGCTSAVLYRDVCIFFPQYILYCALPVLKPKCAFNVRMFTEEAKGVGNHYNHKLIKCTSVPGMRTK